MRLRHTGILLAGATVIGGSVVTSTSRVLGQEGTTARPDAGPSSTDTPIKHLVVIFGENVSFDHYFGTYPNATNPAGQPPFHAASNTPTVNGLSSALLTANPNLSNPQRLGPAQAVTCDQNHDYTNEQAATDHGVMDRFVEQTSANPAKPTLGECLGKAATPGNNAVMDYYDGNTVTGLWNYAQHFAMSDNSFNTGFGPSTPGAFAITSGNPAGTICATSGTSGVNTTAVYNAPACKPSPYITYTTPPASAPGAVMAPAAGTAALQGPGTVYGDPDPYYDTCSNPARGDGLAAMGGRNIGDTLNAAKLTWGWFQGGFSSPGYTPGVPSSFEPAKVCTGTTARIVDGVVIKDYSAHHEPFQYFPQTSNPRHLPPTSVAGIGTTDQANHQYDVKDFFAAAGAGHLPAVSFVKAVEAQDGHAGYSDPLDEQKFIVSTINTLEKLPEWGSTAVLLMYDDSDGWYDHVLAPVINQSQTALDTLSGPGQCGGNPARVPVGAAGPQQARCGYGPRLPLLVVSPWARTNFVDHATTDQSSVVRFIEDNWRLARLGGGSSDAGAGSLYSMFNFRGDDGRARALVLDPLTGRPVAGSGRGD